MQLHYLNSLAPYTVLFGISYMEALHNLKPNKDLAKRKENKELNYLMQLTMIIYKA